MNVRGNYGRKYILSNDGLLLKLLLKALQNVGELQGATILIWHHYQLAVDHLPLLLRIKPLHLPHGIHMPTDTYEWRDHVPTTLLQRIQIRKKLGQSLLLLQTLQAFCGDCMSCKSCARNHPEPLSAAGCPGTQRSSVLCLKHHK
jgi:hypothetical protein